MTIERLDEPDLKKLLKELPTWELVGRSLVKTFSLKDFRHVLDLTTRIGNLAEDRNHHPDLFLHQYRKLTVTLTTHSAQGLTRLDFDLARQIDALC